AVRGGRAMTGSGATDYTLGLDLGQAADHTALAVLERRWLRAPDDPHQLLAHYGARHLKRWQLKTPYPAIVDELAALLQAPPAAPPLAWPLLVPDQTGVGAAVVHLIRRAGLPARLQPVLITAGHEVVLEEGVWHVPKKELVSVLQVLLQARRLKVAALPERE